MQIQTILKFCSMSQMIPGIITSFSVGRFPVTETNKDKLSVHALILISVPIQGQLQLTTSLHFLWLIKPQQVLVIQSMILSSAVVALLQLAHISVPKYQEVTQIRECLEASVLAERHTMKKLISRFSSKMRSRKTLSRTISLPTLNTMGFLTQIYSLKMHSNLCLAHRLHWMQLCVILLMELECVLKDLKSRTRIRMVSMFRRFIKVCLTLEQNI